MQGICEDLLKIIFIGSVKLFVVRPTGGVNGGGVD